MTPVELHSLAYNFTDLALDVGWRMGRISGNFKAAACSTPPVAAAKFSDAHQ